MCLKIKNRAIYPVSSRNAAEDPRGLYHTIMPEQIEAAVHSPARSCTVNLAPTDTDRNRNRPPNRADRISPERSPQTGSALHSQPAPDFSRLSGQWSAQPIHNPLFVMPEKGFLRLSANFSDELHQITVMRNCEMNENRAFASFLQTRGISN